jgi:predicted RND superfamily exporter protein
MNTLFEKYTSFIVKRRRWVILAILLITGFLGSRLMNLQVDMDQDTWVPQSHPFVKTTKELQKMFGGREIVMIGIAPKNGDIFQPEVLARVDRIQREIENMPEAIRHNVISLAANKVKDIKGTTDGLEVQPMMARVPTTPAEMDALRVRVARNQIYSNSLVSPDYRAAAVIADFKLDYSKPSYEPLMTKIRAILDRERTPEIAVYVAGLPVDFGSFEHNMMQMPIFFGVAMLIIMLIQYFSFRSFQGMLLPIVTAMLSVVWALGFMGLSGVHMDGLNTTTPILIMAVAAGHSIQILKRYYEDFHRLRTLEPHADKKWLSQRAVVECMGHVGPIVGTASLIAIITFYTLTHSEVSASSHFGFFAGSGVLATLILEMTLIPALRASLPAPKLRETNSEQMKGPLDKMLGALARGLAGGRAPMILAAGVLLVAAIGSGAFRINVDNSLKNFSRPDSLVRTDDKALNNLFGGTNTVFFLVEGLDADAIKDPKILKGMDVLQNYLATQPNVGKVMSIVDIVKRLNQSMHGDDPAFNVVPNDQKLIAQYLFMYSLSGGPQDFSSYVDNDYKRAAMWVFVKTDSTTYATQLHENVQSIIKANFPPGVSVRMGGSLAQTVAGNHALTQDKSNNVFQMIAVVFILSSLVLRSLVGGVFVTLPLMIVVFANFGVMGWLGIPLDMGTMTTAAMAIGIGADYELYLLFRFKEELSRTNDSYTATYKSLVTSGKAVIYVALSVAAGYSFLLTSGFAFYTRLAVMVIATMIVSGFVAVIFLRAMTMVFKPNFIYGNKQKWTTLAVNALQKE